MMDSRKRYGIIVIIIIISSIVVLSAVVMMMMITKTTKTTNATMRKFPVAADVTVVVVAAAKSSPFSACSSSSSSSCAWMSSMSTANSRRRGRGGGRRRLDRRHGTMKGSINRLLSSSPSPSSSSFQESKIVSRGRHTKTVLSSTIQSRREEEEEEEFSGCSTSVSTDDDSASLSNSTSTNTTNTSTTNTGRTVQRHQVQEISVTILHRGEYHIVVEKPPGVVCHYSDWSGTSSRRRRKRKRRNNDGTTNSKQQQERKIEIPMLQRTREAVKTRVNLVHRLDRGASGCLLLTYANRTTPTTTTIDQHNNSDNTHDHGTDDPTTILQQVMATTALSGHDDDDDASAASSSPPYSKKTYLALVRGECIVSGRDLRQVGWFKVDKPIRNEKGVWKNATTYFKWIAGQDNDNGRLVDVRPRASLVLARPVTGRWHQIRKHLNGLSSPIIGDSSHGNSKTNREWRTKFDLPPERTCLHLLNIQLQPNNAIPSGLNVSCPVSPDIQHILRQHMLPYVIDEAKTQLLNEGLCPNLLLVEGRSTDNNNLSSSRRRREVVTIKVPIETTD